MGPITRKVLAAIVFAVVAVTYFRLDPVVTNLFPKCPFRLITRLDCPGCGSQRAVHALLNGKLTEAAGYNLLLVASLPFLALHAGARAYNTVPGKIAKWELHKRPKAPFVVLAVIICFWIVRNLPGPLAWLAA